MLIGSRLFMRRRAVVIGALFVMTSGFCTIVMSSSTAQKKATSKTSVSNEKTGLKAQDVKGWDSVRAGLVTRQNKVKQLFMQGYVSSYITAKSRRKHYKEQKSELVADSIPVPLDGNSIQAFSWFTDGEKWRLDIRRAYPSIGRDFKQISFDGERYHSYDEYSALGQISATTNKTILLPGWSEKDFSTFSESTIFGGGLIQHIGTFLSSGVVPTYQKNEIVNEVSCEKYVFTIHPSPGYSTNFQIWFAHSQNVIVKVVHKDIGPAENGSSVQYIAADFKLISGIYVPQQVKTELYRVRKNEYEWLTTNSFVVDEIKINDRNSVSAFQHPVRVTAEIEDQLNAPGKLRITGGVTDAEIERVRAGTPPKLEVPGVTPDGAAPEVAEAQAKEEARGIQPNKATSVD